MAMECSKSLKSNGEGVSAASGADESSVPFLQSISTKSAHPHQAAAVVSNKDRDELQTIAQNWVSWQCRMISGVICGGLYVPESSGALGQPLALFPQAAVNSAYLASVAVQTQSSISRTSRPNQQYGRNKGQTCDLLACPLMIDDKLTAIVSLMVAPRSQPQRDAVIQLLEWGMQWLEALLRQKIEGDGEQGQRSMELLSTVVKQQSVEAAAIDTVNKLAGLLGCERISLGLNLGLSTRLAAISDVSHFDGDSQMVREIEAAMDEATDQSARIVYPGAKGPSAAVVKAHSSLARQRGDTAVCTLLLPGRTDNIGALTCEWEGEHQLNSQRIELGEKVASLVGPVIDLLLQEERSLMAKSVSTARRSLGQVFGLGQLKFKLVFLIVLVGLCGLSLIQGQHQVKATATLQGQVRQLLVAPQDGYINQGMVTAGELVAKGDMLATLDDRTLQLEQQKWQSELNKLKKQYQQAFSKRERSQIGILKSQIAQVTSEIQLIEDQISRMSLKAPFDGMVVSGDLSQAQGSPVTLGQVLFEVTPLDNYRVMLEVDEHDIGQLEVGQTGRLVMAALPQRTFGLTLDKVIPVAISGEGATYFRVEATMDSPATVLRPGMRGVAKISIEQRDLLWVWTHEVVDRLRLWAWSAGIIG